MKNKKTVKKVKLTAATLKGGVMVPRSLLIEEVPLHKLKARTLNEVEIGREAKLVSHYGRRYAILLPLAE